MSVTVSSVKSFAPEFDALDSTRVQMFIDYAAEMVCALEFGGSFDLAHTLMTCHMLKMNPETGGSSASGDVSSEKVGDLARTYAMADYSSLSATLASTRYGLQLKMVMNSKVMPILAIN